MIVKHILIGLLGALLAFVVSLLSGMSLLSAILVYCVAGFSSMIASAALQILVRGSFTTYLDTGTSALASGVTEQTASNGPLSDETKMFRILAVDDDPSLLALIPMIAAEAEFDNVTTVSSGAMALDAIDAADNNFDCFLLDINMPGMNGIELCSKIRKLPDYTNTPIIMLTAMRDIDFLGEAFKAGATEYANKPFDIAALCDRLREAHQYITDQKQAKSGTQEGVLSAADGSHQDISSRSAKTSFGETDNFVEYPTLKTYLSRLSRADRAHVMVCAMKLHQFDGLSATLSSGDTSDLLRECERAIIEIFQPFAPLMAYVGDGTFMIAYRAADLMFEINAEIEIQNDLRKFGFESADIDMTEIVVSIGNPIRLNTETATIRPMPTFDRAIANVEAREHSKVDDRRPTNIRLIGG